MLQISVNGQPNGATII